MPKLMYVAATALMTAAYLWRPRTERGSAPSPAEQHLRGPVVGRPIPLALSARAAFAAVRPGDRWLQPGLDLRQAHPISGVDLDRTYTSHGELLFLNNLSTIAFWIVVAHYVSSGRRISWETKEGWFTALLALNAIALPFYASSRSDALLTLLGGAGIAVLLRTSRDPPQAIVAVGGRVLVPGLDDDQPARARRTQRPALQSRRRWWTVWPTHSCTTALPTRLSRRTSTTGCRSRSRTRTAGTSPPIALAPIPRAIWPEKPLINIGPVIGKRHLRVPTQRCASGLGRRPLPQLGSPGGAGRELSHRVAPRPARQVAIAAADPTRPAFAVLYMPLALTFTKNLMNKGLGAAFFNGGTQFALTALCLLWIGSLREHGRCAGQRSVPAPVGVIVLTTPPYRETRKRPRPRHCRSRWPTRHQ